MYPLKRYKKSFPYSYTFGVFPTLELITNTPGDIDRIIIHSKGERNRGVQKIITLCEKQRLPIETNDRAIEKLASKANVFAAGVFTKHFHELAPAKNHVVLIHPGSMGNLGTIMRTMLGFGIRDLAIILPAADPFDPKTIRASMGAVFRLRVARFESLPAYLAMNPRHAYLLTGAGETRLDQVHFNEPYALIFGNESSGIDSSALSLGTSVTIPQSNQIDSFNLAVSVAITLYQTQLPKT